MAVNESLLTPTSIKLYGRVMTDLTLQKKASHTLGSNKFLSDQIQDKSSKLARIYGFSYEGVYYELVRPAVFLVHGEGSPAQSDAPKGSGANANRRHAPAPGSANVAGVAAREWEFGEDVKFWEYDKGDFSIRLDIETGPLEQILVTYELGPDAAPFASGANARVSGANARVSGANARVAGANARVAGANARARGD